MREDIFRKKSIDRIKSPENLDDYIKVANPGIWLILGSILILLIGACVWGYFGKIESSLPVVVYAEEGEISCYVREDDVTSVQTGMIVRLEDRELQITSIKEKQEKGYLCILNNDPDLADGYYEGKIIIKSYRPFYFVLN